MKLYVTDNGTWGGTQAEMPAKCRDDGSRQGGWKQVDVPTDKTTLIEFLNHNKVGAAPPAPRVRQREAPPPPTGGIRRWRVMGGLRDKVFISAVGADTAEDACQQVAETLTAYQPGE